MKRKYTMPLLDMVEVRLVTHLNAGTLNTDGTLNSNNVTRTMGASHAASRSGSSWSDDDEE